MRLPSSAARTGRATPAPADHRSASSWPSWSLVGVFALIAGRRLAATPSPRAGDRRPAPPAWATRASRSQVGAPLAGLEQRRHRPDRQRHPVRRPSRWPTTSTATSRSTSTGCCEPIPLGIGIVEPQVQTPARATPPARPSATTGCTRTPTTASCTSSRRPPSSTRSSDFFAIWGQPLSATQVGPATGKVTAYVNGKVFTGDPQTITLSSHEDIQLDVGKVVAPGRPSTGPSPSSDPVATSSRRPSPDDLDGDGLESPGLRPSPSRSIPFRGDDHCREPHRMPPQSGTQPDSDPPAPRRRTDPRARWRESRRVRGVSRRSRPPLGGSVLVGAVEAGHAARSRSPVRPCRRPRPGRGGPCSTASARSASAARHDGDHADAQVEGALHLGLRDPAAVGDQPKIGGGDQVDRSSVGVEPRGQHPGQVGGQPAAGDVGEGVDVDLARPAPGSPGRRSGSGSSSSSPSVPSELVERRRPAAAGPTASSTWRTSE